MKTKKIILWIWIRYYTCLWCVRCYIWNPLKNKIVNQIDNMFDNADYYMRNLIGKLIK